MSDDHQSEIWTVRTLPAPSAGELQRLVQRIAERIGRSLERSGFITRDIENAYLAFDSGEAPASVTVTARSHAR